MITENGQKQLLRVISGKAYRFADLFVVGASGESIPDSATSLDFAWATTPVLESYVDENLNQVMFHGTLDKSLAGDIKEIGLVSLNSEFISTGLPVSIVYTFDASELWFSDINYEITNTSSVGATNYKFVDAPVGSYLAKLTSDVNISRYDTVKMRVNSSGVQKIELHFKNDDLNYAWKEITLTNGATSITQSIDSFTRVGTFNPTKVSEVRIVVKQANATNSIEFDALTLSSNLNGGLVARTVQSVTQYKRMGASMEIEFAVTLDLGLT